MRINFAHLRERARSGGSINFAVFDARSHSGTESDNSALLAELTGMARAQNLRVDQSALAFRSGGRLVYFGTPTLVQYLSRTGIRGWTHYLET